MRALATTALTLAFVLMAAITYLSVRHDPLGGEPHAMLQIVPPNLDKLQAAAKAPEPAPRAVVVPPAQPATSPGETASIAAPTPADQPPQPVTSLGVTPAQPKTNTDGRLAPGDVKKPALTSQAAEPPAEAGTAATDPSVEGVTLAVPQ